MLREELNVKLAARPLLCMTPECWNQAKYCTYCQGCIDKANRFVAKLQLERSGEDEIEGALEGFPCLNTGAL